jgi:two-component system, cell cycle sensor histidine kinase and response regulator CckA
MIPTSSPRQRYLTPGNSLSRRLGFSMTWVVMAILVVFSAGLFLYSSVKIERELQRQLEETVKFAQTSLPTAIWQLNYSSMNDVLQAILINDVIAAAQILAEEHIVATKTAKAYVGEEFSFFEGSKQFLVQSVDVYSSGEKAGVFRVAVSRQSIQHELLITAVGVIVLALLLFIAILSTSLFVTRKYVFKPLKQLEYSARRIAEGDLDTPINTDGGDEIARLARAFATMADRLQVSFSTLEKKVGERTADLIDARIETEKINQELRTAGAEIQALLDNYPVGILFVSNDRVIKRVNAEMLRISGYSHRELLGKTTRMFYASEEEYLENGRKNYPLLVNDRSLEIRNNLLRKDGTTVVCNWRARRISSVEGFSDLAGVVWSVEDISNRLQMEKELLKVSKLESVALLAGGIAHDFNNILVAILGNVSLAERLVDEDHRARELLSRAVKASLRARDLVAKLLSFAKGGEPLSGIATLPDLLRETVPFVLSGSNVRCEYDIPESLWAVNMERGQVDQVFQNLVLNADQAMPEGGTLCLSCRNQLVLSGQIPGLEPGKYVRVEVLDNGCGIEPENIDRIFDPYFSTKEKDSTKGSGLGLSITHSIIAKYHGRITVRSLPGQGTAFTLYLPAIAEEVTAENEAGSGIVFGSGTIMVMDDEEMVRGVAREMLTHLGYDCLEAEDGSEAITLYEKSLNNGKKIDALIMDLTIPGGMGGKEAMRQLLRLDPQARGIVSSGYSHDQLLHDYHRAGFCAIVSKPYQLQELSQALAAVIAGEAHPLPHRPATLN